jgi:hypothetical protein
VVDRPRGRSERWVICSSSSANLRRASRCHSSRAIAVECGEHQTDHVAHRLAVVARGRDAVRAYWLAQFDRYHRVRLPPGMTPPPRGRQAIDTLSIAELRWRRVPPSTVR